jgi:hypothetical protein
MLGVWVVLVTPNRAAARLVPEVSWADADSAFRGGATWKPAKGLAGRAGWPMVTLELHPQGLVVRATLRRLAFLFPRIELRWADITCVERRPTGVRIIRSDRPGASVLFQLSKEAVLQALRSYPVVLK